MAEVSEDAEAHERKRDKFGKFVQKSYGKGELALKHAIGLGAGENVVPLSYPITNGPPRPVHIGWHPVGGFAGKWFAEKTGLGKLITEKTNSYPDPTQHWAVLVGEYAHQLWMDENFDIIYTNSRIDPKEWTLSAVGQTTFNDDALRRTGEAVIQHIRTTRPGYNLITNNCQTYVLQLLDAVQVSTVKEFGTTEAVYQRLFGAGKVADLFVDHMHQINDQGPGAGQYPALPPPGQQELGVVGGVGGQGYVPFHRPEDMLQQYNVGTGQQPQTSVQFAQQVMDANTTQVNAEEMNSRDRELGDGHHEDGGWREKTGSFLKKKFKR